MDDPVPQAAYSTTVETIREHVGDLGTALAIWSTRDDARPCPAARHAANDAMDAIDGALAGLHTPRRSLVFEIRASDDAGAIRADELLARCPPEHHEPRAARGRVGPPGDSPWARTSDRHVWRAHKRGLVLTVTRLAGGGWHAAEGPGVTERSPMPFRTRKHAQSWADNRAGGAS